MEGFGVEDGLAFLIQWLPKQANTRRVEGDAHEEYALSKINDKTAFRNEINGRLIKQITEGNPSVIHVGPVVRKPGEMIHS